MGYLLYRCEGCRFEAAIGGPEEFFRAADGSLRPYGHPEPSSEEARERGVDGFWMWLWCEGCAARKRVTTVEFAAPCSALDAWSGRGVLREPQAADAERCPDCATLLNDEIPGLPPPCPACKKSPLSLRADD